MSASPARRATDTPPKPRARAVRLLAVMSLLLAGVTMTLITQVVKAPSVAAVGPVCSPTAPTGGVISEPGHLLYLANSTDTTELAGTYQQTADIDLAQCPGITNWPGIGGGSDALAFTGTYDGGGLTISNVSMSATGSYDLVALFTKTLGATVSGINLQAVTVSASQFGEGAGLIGQAQNTVVNDVTVSGFSINAPGIGGGVIGWALGNVQLSDVDVTHGTVVAGSYTGGVLGLASTTDVVRVSVTNVNVASAFQNVGGLMGSAEAATISDSHAIGVTATGVDKVGGLVGYLAGGSVVNSSAAGTVASSAQTGEEAGTFGGLIGLLRGDNSNAPVLVTSVTSSATVAGFAYDELDSQNFDCDPGEDGGEPECAGRPSTDTFSIPYVYDFAGVGGLIGKIDSRDADITVSAAVATGVVTNPGSTDSVGGLVGHLETAEFGNYRYDVDLEHGFGISIVDSASTGTVRGAAATGCRTTGPSNYIGTTWGENLSLSCPAIQERSGADTTPDVVLPPALSDLVNQPITPSTTEAPSATAPSTTTTVPTTSAPSPVPADGVTLPTLKPGASQVLDNGQPVAVEVFVDNATDLVMRGDGFELRLAGQCTSACTIQTDANGRQVLTLERQGLAKVEGAGFKADTPVYVWLFSEPTYLGELTVNADGSFSGLVPLGDIEIGDHTLQVNGTSQTGTQRSANLGVVVTPQQVPTPGGEVLPSTGTNSTPIWLIAMTLMALGLAATRRRRTV